MVMKERFGGMEWDPAGRAHVLRGKDIAFEVPIEEVANINAVPVEFTPKERERIRDGLDALAKEKERLFEKFPVYRDDHAALKSAGFSEAERESEMKYLLYFYHLNGGYGGADAMLGYAASLVADMLSERGTGADLMKKYTIAEMILESFAGDEHGA